MSNDPNTPAPAAPSDFIRDIVAAHVSEHKYPRIHTRFPPEPNGYLHIGHAKSICLNFGIAREFGGICNLRMDDTNPTKEDIEYVESIQEDVNWLISGWAEDRLGLKPQGKTPETIAEEGKRDFYLPAVFGTSEAERKHSAVRLEPFYASDYFDQIYDYAEQLIEKGNAYVCDLTPDETDEYRRQGKPSPFRDRKISENLDLFQRMKAGEFPDGTRSLRAKIQPDSPNIWMRDPLIYRIKHAEHHHTGDKWCIYPMYDFAHCLSDYVEGITHSICTLEFEVHRPLYDWILESLGLPRPLPHQYEFARLALGYTVMSKRKLMQLVNENLVSGWDDPRMPTISRDSPARRHARSTAQFCLQHRHHEIQWCYRRGSFGIRHPRRLEQTRAAQTRRAAADQSRHHELSRRQNRGTQRRRTIPKRRKPAGGKFRSAASCSSSATILPKCRRRNFSGSNPAARCV